MLTGESETPQACAGVQGAKGFRKIPGLAGGRDRDEPLAGRKRPPEGNDAAALLKLAVQGSQVRFTAAEIEDLNKDIEEGRKGLDKVRAFKLEASVVTARCRKGDEQP